MSGGRIESRPVTEKPGELTAGPRGRWHVDLDFLQITGFGDDERLSHLHLGGGSTEGPRKTGAGIDRNIGKRACCNENNDQNRH